MGSLLAGLFVEIAGKDKGLNRTLAGVREQLAGISQAGANTFKNLAGSMLMAVGATTAIGTAGFGFKKALTEASDLNETLNKTGVIFGESAKVAEIGAAGMADRFGVVKTEFLDVTSQFGLLLQGMGGMSKEASAEMAVNLTKMAADSSSIFNKSFGEAGAKIASALRGESEPISEFGVNVQELAVQQEALRMGLTKSADALTMEQKVMARASLIAKGLKIAQGDLANTSGGFANQTRQVWGRVTNALATVGQAIMPVVEQFLGGFNKMLRGLESWVGGNKSMFAAWAEGTKAVFETVGWVINEIYTAAAGLGARMQAEAGEQKAILDAIGVAWKFVGDVITGVVDFIGFAFRNWSLLCEMAGVIIMEKITNVGETFTWLMGVASTLGSYLANNWVRMIQDGANGVWTVLSNLGKNIGDLFTAVWEAINGNGFNFNFTPLLEGFKATVDKFPEIAGPAYTKMTDDLKIITDKMAVNEAKATKDRIDAANKALKPAELVGPPKEAMNDKQSASVAKEKKATTTDLAGYAKSLQEGIFGKNTAAERTAKAAERTATGVERLNKKKVANNYAAAAPG